MCSVWILFPWWNAPSNVGYYICEVTNWSAHSLIFPVRLFFYSPFKVCATILLTFIYPCSFRVFLLEFRLAFTCGCQCNIHVYILLLYIYINGNEQRRSENTLLNCNMKYGLIAWHFPKYMARLYSLIFLQKPRRLLLVLYFFRTKSMTTNLSGVAQESMICFVFSFLCSRWKCPYLLIIINQYASKHIRSNWQKY